MNFGEFFFHDVRCIRSLPCFVYLTEVLRSLMLALVRITGGPSKWRRSSPLS
jgi:hypothetical protein